jgi:hypothetical protein
VAPVTPSDEEVDKMTVTSQPAGPARSGTPRKWPWIVASVLAVVLLGLAAVVVVSLLAASRGKPEFASLAANPDPTLVGTVAYVAEDGCVRAVAASGQPSEQVYCLPDQDPKTAQVSGKESGPQLVWLDDGRLEITMFSWTGTPGPNGPDLTAAWQRIVDVGTGKVTETPRGDLPAELNLDTHPTVSPQGEQVTFTSDPASGRVSVSLTNAGGTRTLLSATGPASYTYGLTTAFWSPSWDWIAVDDGRILVITATDPPVTRVLVDARSNSNFLDTPDPRAANFAITEQDVLGST